MSSVSVLSERGSSGYLNRERLYSNFEDFPEFPFCSCLSFTYLRLFPSECFHNSDCKIVFYSSFILILVLLLIYI